MTTTEIRIGKSRDWLNPAYRAELAKQFACHPENVEWHLDQREAMVSMLADRRKYGVTRYE